MNPLELIRANASSSRDLHPDVSLSLLLSPSKTLRDVPSDFLSSFQSVAAQAFDMPLEQMRIESVRHRVVEVDVLCVLHNSFEILGFASASEKLTDVLFLDAAVIVPEARGLQLGSALLDSCLHASSMMRLAFITQSPLVFSMVRRRTRVIYPSPEDPIVPEDVRLVGTALVPQNMSPETFVIPNRYPHCLYPDIPRSRDEAVNEWFRTSLRAESGTTRDAFLFVGERVS